MEKNSRRQFSVNGCLNIDQSELPLLVLSDKKKSFFSSGIKWHQRGKYNHMMWLIGQDTVASQDALFRSVPLEKYLKGKHRLRFWSGAEWTNEDKKRLYQAIIKDLKLPWWKRLYDPTQIVGIFFGIKWLQVPGKSRICSDHADALKIIDPTWESGRHLSPPEINRLLNWNPKYYIYGEFNP